MSKEPEAVDASFLERTKTTLANFLSLRALIPFLINQSGSLLFYYAIGNSDISIAVPVCNSIAFLFTAVVSSMIGEESIPLPRAILGIAFVVLGTYLCIS